MTLPWQWAGASQPRTTDVAVTALTVMLTGGGGGEGKQKRGGAAAESFAVPASVWALMARKTASPP